jgi:tetratricopeptide (TPR) repeat protein
MTSHKGLSGLLSRYETLLLLSLALIVILIYANTLGSPFIFDSRNNIESNPHIRISEITLNNLADAAFKSNAHHRPLSNISFALNYYLHGYNVVGYHVVNILIHISSGFLLYLFVKSTFSTPALKSRYDNYLWISFFTAAVWMVHPLQTQSVSYIVQRMNSLAAMFYVLSILLYVRFRLSERRRNKWWLLSGCILAGVLALASKQIAAVLPVFILVYEWYFFRDLDLKWLKKQIPLLIGCFLAVYVLGLFFLSGDPLNSILESYKVRDFTLTQRILTQPRVVIFHLSQLLWPHPSRLNLDHDFPLSNSLTDPMTTIFSIIIIAALIGLAIVAARKQRLLSFCILWFFGNLVIESSIISLEMVFEHRVYLPSMMFCLAVALAVCRRVKPVWLQLVVLCVLVALSSLWTYERNEVYSDRITFWQDCVSKSPGKARPYNNLGVAQAERSRHEEAIQNYHKAIELDPRYQDPVENIGLSLAEQGKMEESIAYFRKALEMDPKNYKTLNNLGASLIVLERRQEAIQSLSESLRLNPYHAQAHNNLGVALSQEGRLDEAIDHFSTAVQLDPEYVQALNSLGIILAEQGRYEEAIEHFSAALKVNPGSVKIRQNLEKSLKAMND